MSLVDGFLNIMRLNPEDDEDDYDFYDDDYEEEEEEKVRKSFFSKKETSNDVYSTRESSFSQPRQTAAKSTPKITPISRGKKGNTPGMEVCVFKPNSMEDAREITETLLLNRTVLLNVEGLNIDIAQRIIDFVTGACFALSGNFQKVSNYIFVITPSEVDISGDFQNLMDSFGVSGM